MNLFRYLLAGLVTFSAISVAEEKPADILTSLPATYMIADQLVQDTNLVVENIAPARYGFERLPGWYDTQGAEEVAEFAQGAKAVVSLGSIWESDPIYLHTRAHNISVINVDAGQALLPNGQSVSTLTTENGLSPFVWLNSANLMRMVEIVGDDFVNIWPEHRAKILENQGELLHSLKQLNAKQQQQLFDADIDSVIILDIALEDFVRANDLFVLDRKFKANLDWNENDIQQIAQWYEEEPEVWILTTRAVNKQLQDLLPTGISVLRIDPVDRWGRGIDKHSPLKRWELGLD